MVAPEQNMDTEQASLSSERMIAQRARAYTLSRRRRRLVWRIALFLAVTTAMTAVAVLNRDTTQLREERKIGQRIVDLLEAETAQRGSPPLMFPSDPSLRLQRDRYYFNIFYAGQSAGKAQTGVCCLKEPVRFFLRPDGRMVILYDGARFSSEWMSEREFVSRARDLGFRYLLGN